MPTWRNQLPPEGKHMGYDLVRTPENGALQAIITCDDIIVADTHFWHGRTLPCERSGHDADGSPSASTCPACNEAIPYRTHVYVSAFDAKRNDHFIYECTAHAAKPLAEHRAAHGTLRGCVIYASRPKGKKNSKVVIETNTANLSKVRLPDAPNVILAMSIIWRLPPDAVPVEHRRYRPPTVTPRADRLRAVDTQPDNAPDPQTVSEILAGNGKPKKQTVNE